MVKWWDDNRDGTLMFAAALVGVAVMVFGTVAFVGGFIARHEASNAYTIEFAHPGDDCGSAAVHFDVTTGKVLNCVNFAPFASGKADFPGFTDAQNNQVATVAEKLGRDGVDPAEQARIRQLVDEYAAGVPDSQRPHDDVLPLGPFRGTRLILLGAACVLIPLVVVGGILFRDR